MDFRLTRAKRERLDRVARTMRDRKHWTRLRALQLLDDGWTVADVAQALTVSRESVYTYVERWHARGQDPTAMGDAPRCGGPPILDEAAMDRLDLLLEDAPSIYGYTASGWTLPLLQVHLRRQWQIRISATTLRIQLHRLGWEWKRPRFVCAGRDPLRDAKLRALRALVAHAIDPAATAAPPVSAEATAGAPLDSSRGRAVVLVEDETHVRELPPLRAAWSRRGAQATVPITGQNARRTVFGALNVVTGARYLFETVRNRAADFQQFLEHVRRHIPRTPILLILDRGSCHIARTSQQYAAERGITLAWLPTACPELNPIESLWRTAKAIVCANRVYTTVAEQVRAFCGYLRGLSSTQALRKAGLLSENTWLPT